MTNISGKSHFNPTVKNYHAVPHIGQISSCPTTAAVPDSFPHAGNSPNGKSSPAQNTSQRLHMLQAVLQAAHSPCTASLPSACKHSHSTALQRSSCSHHSGNSGATSNLQKWKPTPRKSEVTSQNYERTQDSSHSSFTLQYRIWRIPMTVFTFTVIMTQSESQPSLIHQNLMLLFWQFWAICCHKDRNIREVKWQK